LRVRDRVAGRNGRDDGELRRLSPIRKSNELRWQRQDAVRLKREAKQGEGGVAGTPEPAGVERAERGRLREPERRRSSYSRVCRLDGDDVKCLRVEVRLKADTTGEDATGERQRQ